jgi:periplasmic protein TonB
VTSTTDKSLLLDAVFGGQPARRRPGLRLFALIAAFALHAGLWLLSQLSGPSLETWSARVAAMVHHDLNANAPTAIETIKLPEPEPEPPAAPPAAPPPQAAAPQPKAARAAAPQPSASAAQTAQVIAADAPVDLTADTFVTGTASAYAGGASTTRGESTTKVDAVAAVAAQTTDPSQSQTVAQPVSLTSEQWQCPWPVDALAQDLYEQFVIVRAWVREDGSVERASVVSDPGYGFGAAAMACALRTRFNPARNARGAAVRSLSPPIRVRFTR